MGSMIAAVGDALRDEIAGHDFGVEFESERSYGQWDDRLDELERRLRIDVVVVTVPVVEDVSQASQEDVEYKLNYDVVIRKLLNGEGDRDPIHNRIANDAVDRLVYVTEQVLEFLAKRPLAGYDEASWESMRLRVVGWRKHLKEYGQFTSIIRVTYSVVKTLP